MSSNATTTATKPHPTPSGSGGGGCPYARLVTPDDDGASLTSSGSTGTGGGADNSEHQHEAEVREALSLARSSCPAFREDRSAGAGVGGTCPFKNAGSAEEMRKTMMTVPPSHVGENEEKKGREGGEREGKDVSAPFRLVLEHVHNVSKSIHGGGGGGDAGGSPQPKDKDSGDRGAAERFVLKGGCPFKMFHRPPANDAGGGDAAGTTGEDEVPFVQAMEVFSLSAIMGQMADDLLGGGDSGDEGEGESSPPSRGGRGGAPAPVATAPAAATDPPARDDPAPAPAPRVSLSSALRVGTTESHRAAENVHFVRNFIKGEIRPDLYRTLVSDLYHVYSALEAELDRLAPSSAFATLHRPAQLGRTDALRSDLAYFHGPDWESKTEVTDPSPATADYVGRIHHVADSDPLLLLAHAYTRYLGDLSGGRVLARVARRALDLPKTKGDNGLSFYDFPNITGGEKRFKDWYRSALDDLELSPAEVRRLVAEANVAFALNMRLFEELDVRGGEADGATVRPLGEALAYHDRARGEGAGGGDGDAAAAAAECPFAGMAARARSSSKRGGGARNAERAVVASAPDGSRSQSRTREGGERCPWPFVFLHDPVAGLGDVQTWVVLFAIGCWAYHRAMLASDDARY